MFLKAFVRVISLLLSAVMSFASPFAAFTGARAEKISHNKENCRLSFAAVSDTHLRGNFKPIFQGMLELGLRDMENAADRLDCVAFVGDITNHGDFDQWNVFDDALSKYDIADNTMIVVGNHDTWGPNREEFDNPVDGVKQTFIRYNKLISDRDINEMYYSDVINGCPFIVLGSESDHTDAFLSDRQLSWFAAEMEKASATGLPIFVLLHQPINGTHGLPYSWEMNRNDPPEEGGIGEQSAQVEEILKKYDNVFYISGHIHAGFRNEDGLFGAEYASVEYMKNNNGNPVTLINLPSYLYPDYKRGGHFANGCGFVFEVYDGEVIIRARNFAAGTWLTKYDKTVALVK